MRRKSEETSIIKSVDKEDCGLGLSYSLVKRVGGAASSGIPQYSIKIELTHPDGRKTEASARDVFADVGKALVFFDRMVKNCATPIDLAYVIEDELR